MRFLVTGATGFAGVHLTQHLLAAGHAVFGVARSRVAAGRSGPARRVPLPADHFAAVEVTDTVRMTALLRAVRPDGIFHLAGFTNVPASFEQPEQAYRTNLFGALAVFQAVRDADLGCRVACVGSSHAYGLVHPDELPITEACPFRPLSPYAVSKAAADLAAYQWSQAHGLEVVRVRPFSHTGPGQSGQFVCAQFARQLIEIERGVRPPQVAAGNLDVVRDFTDVRDVVRGYLLAWEHGVRGEAYNVCSGVARTPRDIIDGLMRAGRIEAAVVVQPERQRAVDTPVLVGSAVKLHAASEWSPAISWEQTLSDLLDDWRARL